MGEKVSILHVVVASPGDVQQERDVVPEVLEQLNQSICCDRGLLLRAVRWETDTFPGFDQLGPQGLIDPILRIQDCDLLVGIFWKRFGTPVKSAESGTEYEIRRAYEAWKTSGHPQIMVYFNQKKHSPGTKNETDQWGRVLQFKEQFPEQGLFWKYNGKAHFKELLRTHLTNYILNRYPVAQAPAASPSLPDNRGDYFAVQARVIAEHDRTFVGRSDAIRAFDQFLNSQPRGYFVVRGGPGQGKTALSCHLIQTRGYVHHLVSRTGGRADPGLILRSLLSQILPARELPGLTESLSGLTKAFEEALPFSASKRTPLVVVIDALDELPPAAGEPLYLVSEALPEHVFFFVTCRPGDRLDSLQEHLFAVPHQFHDLGPLSLSDMRDVLALRKPDISTAAVERIAEASQGNPLYLCAVGNQLSIDPAYDVRDLPASIEGFFQSSASQLRTENAVFRDVLGSLAVARTSLSVRELSRITGNSHREINEQGIHPIRQFLLEIDGSYTFYHMKFHEFVTRKLLYEDELRKSHAAIASWLQRPENASNQYRWASLAHHLFESGDRVKLATSIDSQFLAEKVRRFGYAVLEDVELCTRALLESGDPSVVERCVAMVEGLREIAGGDIIADAARAVQAYRAGPESFRTKLIEPDVPSAPNLDVYVGVLPKAEIAADFFEFVPRNGLLAVAIGDAPSIGLKSTFAARFIANLFHTLVVNADPLNLTDLLARLNSTIANHEYFRRVSMQCLDIDSAKGVFHIVNAGHPYPVHYSAHRAKCDVLPVAGDLLHDYSLRPESVPAWEEYGVEIARGDIIVLISDGLTEGHLLKGDPYGYRFTRIIESRAREGSRAIGQAILDDWKAHLREEDSADDVSVIVIAVGPRSGAA